MIARLLLLFALATAASARPLPVSDGIVSAADPRAVAAGTEILGEGGSAADAAVAMMLALNVVEPQSSGIGGGGFMLHHDAASGRTTSFDGRETAPAAADPHWFYVDGQPLTHAAAVPGGRSVGVPGNLRMMALAHARYGRLRWAALFRPAIRLARGGFVLSPRLHNLLASYGDIITTPAMRGLFYAADGSVRPAGSIVRNPAQAALLTRIAARGPDAFYEGPEAARIVRTVNGAARNPSRMSAADLAGYAAKERAPLCAPYRIYRICSMGPPSSGGVTVLLILKQLERFDLAGLGRASPVAWHLLAESERLAYADRDAYLGDPAFVQVPIAGLLDPRYIAARSALIAPTSTLAAIAPGRPDGAPPPVQGPATPEHGTTDMAAIDAQGDVAEVTSTIESVFGSGLGVDGVFLNNELTDFDIVPEQAGVPVANRVEGGKRPRSSMAPTIVYNADGTVRLAIGAAGGSTIIAQVAKAIVGVLDWHLSAQDAIAMGLLYAPSQGGVVERGTELEPMLPALAAMGERLHPAALGLKANAVERVGGRWIGAADPRSEGTWARVGGGPAVIAHDRHAAGAPHE